MEDYLLAYWLVPTIILVVFMFKAFISNCVTESYNTGVVGVKLFAGSAIAIHVVSYVAIQFGL